MTTYTLTLSRADAMAAAIIVMALAAGLLTSFAVAYLNHRYTLAQGKKIAAAWIHIILVAVSGLFTGIQYYIPFLQEHLRTLETLPYIGSYVVGIYAAAVFLYGVRAKKWFQALLKTAQKLDAKATALPGLVPETALAPAPPAEDLSNFSVH